MGHNRNLADYAHHFDGTHIDLGSGNIETQGVVTYEDVTNVDAIGIITARTGVKVPDNQKVFLGTGDDLQIYHNATDSFIVDNSRNLLVRADGTGDLYLQSDNKVILSDIGANEIFIECNDDADVKLFYNNNQKLATTTTGATVTGTLVSDSVTSELDLSAISSSISDTAVDVFVYDTRKDSDGGAWRKRTQHTSWYNETLNTSLRGSRREFPAVAVLVLTSDTLTIYDGDDPNLPMWMVFPSNGYLSWASSNAPTLSSIHMLNGIFVTGATNGRSGLYTDFIKDDIRYVYNVQYYNPTDRTIRGRGVSVTGSGSAYSAGGDGFVIVANEINDVAMTVLPNAPVDSATGLPVLTIAVATDGGVSVIKDDGSVVDIRRTSDDDVHHVALDGDRVIMFMELGAIYVATIPSADQSGNPNSAWSVYGSYGGNTSGTDHPAIQAYGPGLDLVSMKDHTFATAGYNTGNDRYKGLSILSENVNSSGNGMVAWIRSDCNTGYMHGDIKGAFLSDTNTTNVTEDAGLITGSDSTFDDTIANLNWSERSGSSGAWNVSGGVLKTGTVSSGEYLDITTSGYTSGQAYVISYTLSNVTGSMPLRWRFNNGQMGNLPTSNGSQSYYVTLTETGTLFSLLNDNNLTADIDNFKIQLVQEEDRSVNNIGLQVFGTVAKSAVATGADLVAYSGFSASNHLAQPYNSDLNPGSGSYSVVAWFKTESNNSGEGVITGLGNADSDEVMVIYVSSSYGIYFDYGSASEYVYLSNSNDKSMVRNGKWHQVVCQVTAGQIGEIYIDGIKKSTAQNVAAPSTWSQWDTNYRLYIGCGRGLGTLPFSGSISLVRYSLSKISTEQIKKMYEDEKVLFQENAKATLYGSSDAVTALGYDEDTELLHVGTSAGRSDFQGLRRINNTTTAVTTAISASDELIAEQ